MGVGGNGTRGRADSGRGSMGTKGTRITGVLGWLQSRAPPPGSAHLWHGGHQPCTTTQPLPQNTESSRYRPSEERLVREVPCLSYATPQDRSCPSSYSKVVSGTVGSQALGLPVRSPVPIPIRVRPGLGDPWSHHQFREVHCPTTLLPGMREKRTEPAMGPPYYLLPQQQALCQDHGDPRWSGWHPG